MRWLVLVLVGCAAPGIHGGLELATTSDGRWLLQASGGGDVGFTDGDLATTNAVLVPSAAGTVGVDLGEGRLVGSVRYGFMGAAHQRFGATWGARAMAGAIARFERGHSTFGPFVEYWHERVIRSSVDPGPCPDEGEYRFHSLGTGLVIDLGFGDRRRVWTATLGGHYLWQAWAHVHPFTECGQTRPVEPSG